MHKMEQYYKKFLNLQINFNLELSNQIFGNILGKHLFEKWIFYDRNIIEFIYHLDNENKQKIFDFLEN